MKITKSNLAALALLMPLCAFTASADAIVGAGAPNMGSVTYTGGATPLTGGFQLLSLRNGLVSLIPPDLSPAGVSFSTGNLISTTSSAWIFAGGGSLTVGGCFDADSDPGDGKCDAQDISGTSLISGTFTGNQQLDSQPPSNNGVNPDGAGFTGIATLDPTLTSFFGLPSGPYGFLLSFAAGGVGPVTPPDAFAFGGNGEFAGGTLTLTPLTSVPEPSSLLLLGTGLLALVRLTWRKKVFA